MWDAPINKEEFENSIFKAKKGKAVGMDAVNLELVIEFHKLYPDFLPSLFNSILQAGIFPQSWSTALVVLIHKKGCKSDLSNYRGISLLSSLAKIFCSILNERISTWAEENSILNDSQLGFRRGNRTSDALTILHNLINEYCHKKQKPIFGCFVDFKKAFDTVPRDKLLNKLSACGIGGKVLDVIKSMYSHDFVVIKLNNNITTPIEVNQGVRQGCVLSPTLFNLYMSDFPPLLSSDDGTFPVSIDSNTKIHCILWADDIVLLSESRQGMQKQLNLLESFSAKNLLELNVEKTKALCFNKKGSHIHMGFNYHGEFLEDVKEYVYLGFLVKSNGSVQEGIQNLQDRALKSFFSIRKAFSGLLFKFPMVAFRIFDSIVKPIALYASDFWGLNAPNISENPLCDQIHNHFCKQLLGISKHASNSGVYRELGRYPISIDGRLHCFNNWTRVVGRKKCNPLTLKSAQHAVTTNGASYTKVQDFLTDNHLTFLLPKLSAIHHRDKTMVSLKKLLLTKFNQSNSVKFLTNSKLAVLKLTKTTAGDIPQDVPTGMSPYVMDTNIHLRSFIAKLRLSVHSLEIETGRYANIPRSRRICKLCQHGVEDVHHFLLTCQSLQCLRTKFFDKMANLIVGFYNMGTKEKIIHILNPTELSRKAIASFLNSSFTLRSNMLINLA